MKNRMDSNRVRSGQKAARQSRAKTGQDGARPGKAFPDIDAWITSGPGTGQLRMAMWPMVLLAVVSGLAFELTKYVVSETRRHIYNRNRNVKYAKAQDADRKKAHKNMTWRTKPSYRRHKVILSPPPAFAEDLCRQWDRIHDSLGEMLRFGEMVIELEDYVDNAFEFDAYGEIVGRRPGIKGFLNMHCPHIGYSAAIRCRILAMKAQEVARRLGTVTKILTQCDTVRELEGKLDACLGVGHRRQEHPCRRQRRRRRSRGSQPVVFSVRDVVHSAVGQMDAPDRQRVVSALMEIARELSAS